MTTQAATAQSPRVQVPSAQSPAPQSASVPLSTATGDEVADLALWQRFRRANAAQPNSTTQQNVTRALQFLRSQAQAQPALSPPIAVEAWAAMAGVVERTLKDPTQALAIYDEAWRLYGKEPRAAALLVHQTRFLLRAGRPQDVQTLVDKEWTFLTQAPPTYSRHVLWQKVIALKAQGRNKAVAPFLQKVLLEIPAFLDEDKKSTGAWVTNTLVNELLGQGRPQDALSWAKVRWMECAFDEAEIKDASALLAKVWNAQEAKTGALPTASASSATTRFIQHLTNVSVRGEAALAANPLVQVTVPVLGPQALQDVLDPVASTNGDLLHEQNTHRRVSALILAGRWKRAMTAARQLWLDLPLSTAGVKEIARVYKAHDLSLERANEFVRWNGTRQGANPVEAFLREVQNGDGQADEKLESPAHPPQSVVRASIAKASVLAVEVPLAVETPLAEALSKATPATIPEVSFKSNVFTGAPKELTLNDVLYRVTNAESFRPQADNETLRHALVNLMASQGHKPISQALLDPEARQWTAYLSAAAGDARAVPLLEAMLQEIPKPAKTEAQGTRAMFLLMRLAAYYEKRGDLTKAAQTQLRGQEYGQGFVMPTGPFSGTIPVAGMMANRQLEAARLYQRAGDKQQATQTYAQVARFGYGWASGMALYDQALLLMEQNKHEDARHLLQQPVEGVYADQVKVGLLAGLGASYYRTGDFDSAQIYNQQALDAYQALAHPLKGENLESLTGLARQRIEWGQKWKRAPLIAMPETLSVTVPTTGSTPQHLALYALNEVPLNVSCDDPRIQLGAVTKGWRDDLGYVKKVEVRAELAFSDPQRDFTTTLVVRSPAFPNFVLRVPVKAHFGTPELESGPPG